MVAALTVLSCHSGDSTAPAQAVAVPLDSVPQLNLILPAGQTMTAGTTAAISLVALNVQPKSCQIFGPAWVVLTPGANVNSRWTIAASATGPAPLHAICKDLKSRTVAAFDTVQVFAMPTVTPDISGMVPVGVGDSVDVTYDSTDTQLIDVACQNCTPNATMARVATNTIRFFAQSVPTDTLTRGVCFTVHGLDGHFTQQQCVRVKVLGAQAVLYSVPEAIRQAEVVALHTIPVATYDNTGQSTHPDFMRVAAPWSGGACWLAYTPYAGSNGTVENPSLATSPDCEHWTPAAGVKAPLVDKPLDGYNSDPELLYDATGGCLGVVYRQVFNTNDILMTKSCDGKNFGASRLLFSAADHSAVSPTIAAGPDGVNRAWVVDAGPSGCSSQSNVVRMRTATPTSSSSLDSLQFGAPVLTDLVQPGYVIWHIKIRYIAQKNMYLAMYAAFPMTTGVGNCANDDLFVATSADGLHWNTFPVPMLDQMDRRFNFTTLYRASFSYNPTTDNLRTIVSGLEMTWGQYGVVHNFTALMAALNSSTTAAASQLIPSLKLVHKRDPGRKHVVIEDEPHP